MTWRTTLFLANQTESIAITANKVKSLPCFLISIGSLFMSTIKEYEIYGHGVLVSAQDHGHECEEKIRPKRSLFKTNGKERRVRGWTRLLDAPEDRMKFKMVMGWGWGGQGKRNKRVNHGIKVWTRQAMTILSVMVTPPNRVQREASKGLEVGAALMEKAEIQWSDKLLVLYESWGNILKYTVLYDLMNLFEFDKKNI